MKDREKPSWAIRIFGPMLIIFISFGAMTVFFYRVFLLFHGISSEIVIIEKGSFYLFGVGAGALPLALVCVQEFWIGKLLSRKQARILTRMAIGGVIIMFTLPHLMHFSLDYFLKKEGYSVCKEASHQWLHVRNIVYTQDPAECIEELKSYY